MYDFVVDGSAGRDAFKAVSQEWAMIFYKVKYGVDESVKTVEWVQ
jgi:hypothetical protein